MFDVRNDCKVYLFREPDDQWSIVDVFHIMCFSFLIHRLDHWSSCLICLSRFVFAGLFLAGCSVSAKAKC